MRDINFTKIYRVISLALILAGSVANLSAQEVSPSVDPEREVLVMFDSGAITAPEGQATGRPEEFQFSREELRKVIIDARVQSISRLMPDFQPEDRFSAGRTGEIVQLTDWTHVYVLRLPQPGTRDSFLESLKILPGVVYAEVNGRGEADYIPNDPSFRVQWALKNVGSFFQGAGADSADIKAYLAWDITTGSASISIAIVDGGMQTNHIDFAGRVTGDIGDSNEHGTAVAGVAAAQGDNGEGIAGVAWNVEIINEDYGAFSDADAVAAVISASNRGADVINNSWHLGPVGRYSTTVRRAFSDIYKLNIVAVVSMGGEFGEVIQYPAAFGQGIITVGATTNEDVRAAYSSTGSWIDVVAPGGAGGISVQDDIYTTMPGDDYGWTSGTSFAAPVVTGIAALLLSYDATLYNDDIEQIIRISAENVHGVEFDNLYGDGRVDARAALDLIRFPNTLSHMSTIGGTVTATSNFIENFIFYSETSGDAVKRVTVEKDIVFPKSYTDIPYVWGRGVATTGYSADDPNFSMGYTEVVPGTITTTGARLRTYYYDVYMQDPYDGHYDYYDSTPVDNAGDVVFAYTVVELAPANLALANESVADSQVYIATNSITAGPAFTVESTGDVTFTAGSSITLLPGFHAKAGSDFVASIDPGLSARVVSAGPAITGILGDDLNTAPDDTDPALPSVYALHHAYPNPFNPTVTIRYDLPEPAKVHLIVYNLLGREVVRLVNARMEAGYQAVTWNGRTSAGTGAPSGLYIARLVTPKYSKSIKMILLK